MHVQQAVAQCRLPPRSGAHTNAVAGRLAARLAPFLEHTKRSPSSRQQAKGRSLTLCPAAAAKPPASSSGPAGADAAALTPAGIGSAEELALPDVSEVARQNLKKAANACRRYGWLAFWVQLVLTTVATVILLFSMAFTSQTGPPISLYLTLFSIILGFLSTFWSFGYTRLSNKLRSFLEATSLDTAPKVKRSDVVNMLEKGAIINVLGAGAAMIGLQATIGLLVAKTLTSATVNPFLASTTSSWNPVLAFDVFNVQATTNALLSHFFSLVSSLWLLRIIANRPSATAIIGKSPPKAATA